MKVYEIIAKEVEKKPEERSFHFKQIEGWLRKIGYVILPLGTLKGIGFALNENHSLGERVAEVTITEKEAYMTGNYKLVSYMQMEMRDLFLKRNKFMQTKWGEEVWEMTKDDLKTGMVVRLRCGDCYLILRGALKSEFDGNYNLAMVGLSEKEGFLGLGDTYSKDMRCANTSEFDIVVIYNPPLSSLNTMLIDDAREEYCIWERKTEKELALEKEIEHLKAKLKEAEIELEKERGK